MSKDMVLEQLFQEVRKNFHLLKKGAEVIHKRGDGTSSLRALLELLFDHLHSQSKGELSSKGGLTVAHIAKLRLVSRQSVQVLVDQMIDLGWAQSHPNPFHKTSLLISLTDEGLKAFNRMRKEERAYMKELDLKIPVNKLDDVANVLSEINQSIVQFLAGK
jgi:DNA-binding MarR family transcriptional regulator